jgi:hypothetical protein
MGVDLLAKAFERFTIDHDEAAFMAAIQQHGGHSPSSDLDCPIAHRIRDVSLGGDAYRVVRVYDVDNRTSRLYVYPSETPGEQPGVPYELSGDALHQWVVDELNDPSDGDTDWSSTQVLMEGEVKGQAHREK